MIPEKTPEQLMKEYNVQPWSLVKEQPTPPDYHTMALLAAQTIPNQTVGELLASADKIEAWLRKPEEDRRKNSMEALKQYLHYGNMDKTYIDEPSNYKPEKQKSPEKVNPEASDGVSGD